MRFGVCAGIGDADLLADAGYDYIELSVSRDLMPDATDEAGWRESRRVIANLPLPAEAFNLFVPAALKVVGPEADAAALRAYVNTALERAGQAGGRLIVFGSGGARGVPDGFPGDVAERQILDFLGYCADASERPGVVVVVEPLNRAECNILNTVAEGAAFVRRLDRAGVRNLADTYHIEKNGETLDAIVADADLLAHVHTADTGRGAPGTGTYDHVALFRALRSARYDDRVSIECSWQNLARDSGPALEHLRAAAAAANTALP